MNAPLENAPATRPELSVVIVNWNTAHLLRDCLQSVFDETSEVQTEIIVVDNGSTDTSQALLAEQYPEVDVLALPSNLGYQAACNRGTARASAPVLLHINSDAWLQPGALEAMLAVLDDRPEVGVVGPRLVYGDGSFQRWTAGRVPGLASLGHSFLLGDRFAGRGIWIDHDRPQAGEVGWVSSACLLVRSETFDRIGGLDEQFFAYMDDVDLCGRARVAGWITWYEPRATAVHFMGGSQERALGVSPTAITSMVRWFRVRRGRTEASAAALIMAVGFALRAAAHLVIGRNGTSARVHWRSGIVAIRAGIAT